MDHKKEIENRITYLVQQSIKVKNDIDKQLLQNFPLFII